MPYVKTEQRKVFEEPIRQAEIAIAKSDGDVGSLNYFISSVLAKYTALKGKKYLTILIVMGTLICVAFEYYRRVAGGYEDEKIEENGDVYPEEA